MNQQAVTSFVVRFQKNPVESISHYRIKVTHVQDEKEMTFECLEDVFNYMKKSVEHLEEGS